MSTATALVFVTATVPAILSVNDTSSSSLLENSSVGSDRCQPTSHADRAPTFQPESLTKVVVLLLIALFSLSGNAVTLWSIARSGRQRHSTLYLLVAHLAVADLLVAAFCVLADALWTLSVQWRGGNALCKAVKFAQLAALYLSTFVLVLVGLDRLWAVRWPMARARARHYVRLGLGCAWGASALFGLPQVFIFSVKRGPFVEDFHQCVTHGFYSARWQEQLYTTLSLVLMFLLPLLVLLASYTATFLTIARREHLFPDRPSPRESVRHRILRRAKAKSLALTLVIVLTFALCWTPYYAVMLIHVFLEPSERLSHSLQSTVFFFGSCSAALNPLIYGAFHLRPAGAPRSRATVFSMTTSSARTVGGGFGSRINSGGTKGLHESHESATTAYDGDRANRTRYELF